MNEAANGHELKNQVSVLVYFDRSKNLGVIAASQKKLAHLAVK